MEKDGWTPLHYAVRYKRIEIAKVPIERDRSFCLNSRCISQILVDGKANVNAADEDGWTPLHFAVRDGIADIAKVSIKRVRVLRSIDRSIFFLCV